MNKKTSPKGRVEGSGKKENGKGAGAGDVPETSGERGKHKDARCEGERDAGNGGQKKGFRTVLNIPRGMEAGSGSKRNRIFSGKERVAW